MAGRWRKVSAHSIAMLCARLYASRLGAWYNAEAFVNGILTIAPLGDGKGLGMTSLVRTEA